VQSSHTFLTSANAYIAFAATDARRIHPVIVRQNRVKNCLIKRLIVSTILEIIRSTQTSIMLVGKNMLVQMIIWNEVARRFAGAKSRLASPKTGAKSAPISIPSLRALMSMGIVLRLSL
jgi:hypothetical protein